MIEVKMNSMDGVVLMTAGKKVDENVRVTPDKSLIVPVWDGSYELLVPKVSGVWVFNETLDVTTEFQQNVTFTSDIWNYLMLSNVVGTIYYSESADSYDSGPIVYDNNGWSIQTHRTVDFGTEPQEVSEEFYAWLTENAVKQ